MLSSVMLYFALASMQQREIAPIVSRRPRSADAIEHQSTFRCGADTLQVIGYGISRPPQQVVVLMNGQAVTGDQVEALRHGLSVERGAYRIYATCPHEGNAFYLHFTLGERQRQGWVTVHVAQAHIRDGRLIDYRVDGSNEEAFWYR